MCLRKLRCPSIPSTVAYGTIYQLVVDGVTTSELDRYIEFMPLVNLPMNIEQFDIPNVRDEELRRVTEFACAEGETRTGWSMLTWRIQRTRMLTWLGETIFGGWGARRRTNSTFGKYDPDTEQT